MKKRDQPHDRFYKDLMQDIEVAREFLLNYLDQDIRARIDWDTLALYDTSLIGEANKQLYADVMYAAQTKQHKSEVFFILNHQRKADPLLPIRQLEYILGTLKKSIKQKKQPAFILQLTWYNGKKGPYPYAQSIFDYFQEKELARKLLASPCPIINAHQISDQELASHQKTNVLELFMKYGDNPELLEWLEVHEDIARKLEKNKYISRSLEYVSEVGCHRLEDLLTTFEKVSAKLKETMLTTAQQIRKEGMQQGMQQGMQTRNLEIAKNMLLNLHLGMEVVQKATGLSRAELKKLQGER